VKLWHGLSHADELDSRRCASYASHTAEGLIETSFTSCLWPRSHLEQLLLFCTRHTYLRRGPRELSRWDFLFNCSKAPHKMPGLRAHELLHSKLINHPLVIWARFISTTHASPRVRLRPPLPPHGYGSLRSSQRHQVIRAAECHILYGAPRFGASAGIGKASIGSSTGHRNTGSEQIAASQAPIKHRPNY